MPEAAQEQDVPSTIERRQARRHSLAGSRPRLVHGATAVLPAQPAEHSWLWQGRAGLAGLPHLRSKCTRPASPQHHFSLPLQGQVSTIWMTMRVVLS